MKFSVQQDIEGEPGKDLDLETSVSDWTEVDFPALGRLDILYRWYIAFATTSKPLDVKLVSAVTDTEHSGFKVGVFLGDDEDLTDLQVWCDAEDVSPEELADIFRGKERVRYKVFRLIFDTRIKIRKVKTVAQSTEWMREEKPKGQINQSD